MTHVVVRTTNLLRQGEKVKFKSMTRREKLRNSLMSIVRVCPMVGQNGQKTRFGIGCKRNALKKASLWRTWEEEMEEKKLLGSFKSIVGSSPMKAGKTLPVKKE